MSEKQQTPQTLAVFLLESDDAARKLLKVVQKIDEADKNVKIVDAAIADRSKRRGKVKVHQTEDTWRPEGRPPGRRHRGGRRDHPPGARRSRGRRCRGWHPRGPAQPLPRHRHRRQVHEAGRQRGGEGQERALRPVRGRLVGLDRCRRRMRSRRTTRCSSTAPCRPRTRRSSGRSSSRRPRSSAARRSSPTSRSRPSRRRRRRPRRPSLRAREPDDLTKISGIGPKASAVLVAAGIDSYAQLAGTSEPELRQVFSDAHTAVPRNIGTWAMQASFAEHGDWAGLKAFVKQTQPTAPGKAAAAAPAAAPEPDDLTNLVGHRPEGGEGARGGRHHDVPVARRCERAAAAQGTPREGHARAGEHRHLADAGGVRPTRATGEASASTTRSRPRGRRPRRRRRPPQPLRQRPPRSPTT